MEEGEKKIKKYISLASASKLCSYSQEYLSLRARQGKLRAVKFGRNWVTTKEWLEEYINNRIHELNGTKTGQREDLSVAGKKREIRTERLILPPENLPVGELVLQSTLRHQGYPFSFRILFAVSLMSLVVLLGGIAFLPLFAPSYWNVAVDTISEYGLWVLGETEKIISKDWGKALAAITLERVASAIEEIFLIMKEDTSFAIQFLKEKFQFLAGNKEMQEEAKELTGETERREQNIANMQERSGSFGGNTGIVQKEKEGLVVIPSKGDEEETKKKIRESFSDEVVIEQKDETSGIIRPLFRTFAEQAYLYVMVPLKN